MQNYFVSELPPSSGYEKIVTTIAVFSKYLFAYSTTNQDATTVARLRIKIMNTTSVFAHDDHF